jgi:hypothetical protein
VESVIAALPALDGDDHLWKLSQYYERLDEWDADNGVAPVVLAGHAEPATPQWELYDLTADPEERSNLWGTGGGPDSELAEVLSSARRAQRLAPRHRN